MRSLLLGLALVLARVQGRDEVRAPVQPEPAPRAAEPELARLLLADVRAWEESGELPAPEDLAALLAEAEPFDLGSTFLRELGALGHRLGQSGRDEEARELVAWVGGRALAATDLATQSWSEDWLGQEAWVRGELDEAAARLARAAEIDARRGAHVDRTRHLADVARIRLTQGRFEDARAEVARAEEAARPGGSGAARIASEVQGSLLFELGRHREALARCLAYDGESVPCDEIQVRLDILAADILADVGRLESAVACARRAHETALTPAVRRVAPLLHLEAALSLGLLLGDLSRCDEALALLDGAAAEFARRGDARGAAWTDKNRAYVLFAAGRKAASLPAFERAWRAGEELDVPLLAGLGALGAAEALALDESGAADGARVRAALAVAERVARELHERQLEWRVAALRGRMHLAGGRPEEALPELSRAVVLIERWRRRLGASGLVEHALRQRSDPYRDAAFAAARLGRAEEALAFAGLLQARVLDELRARRDGPLSVPTSPAIEELRERIAGLERELSACAAERRAELEPALERAEDELDAVLLSGELASGRALSAPDGRVPLERLGRALGRQGFQAALVYLAGDGETLALRVDSGPSTRVEGRVLPFGRERMLECVRRLRAPMARLEQGELDLAHLAFDTRAARELHDSLVQPLDLPEGARIALVTDAELGTLPFELLVSGGELGPFDEARPFAHLAGLRFLAEEHVFVRFGSLDSVTSAAGARPGDAVVFLAPAALGPPHASEEARAIALSRADARIVDGARAADVEKHVRGAALVHFAAHGRIDPERPAHCHLVLGGEVAGTSARFESWQAADLELDGALVVLSSCHSGRGAWLAGAGLAGLTRGFLLAGAREVVACHWAVDDRVTARFMELFYAELARQGSTPDALRAARTKLRGETDPRGFSLAHPAFWAAWFVQR
jgi:tetratricopeptide (TPR) repeat protein